MRDALKEYTLAEVVRECAEVCREDGADLEVALQKVAGGPQRRRLAQEHCAVMAAEGRLNEAAEFIEGVHFDAAKR